MSVYRLQCLADLARQMAFAPFDVRLEQIDRAEDLVFLIDPARAYPLDFVIHKITGYRPRQGGDELLAGAALQHDLGLLVEQVSQGMNLLAANCPQPVLQIEDVCARFDVTTKTIQRWRRRGLAARRFIFPDGRQRVGFRLSSVERFMARHRDPAAAAAFASLGPAERGQIVRHARRLVARCSEAELTARVARRLRRSPAAILHILRQHDQEHPARAILPQAAAPLTPAQVQRILEGLEQRLPLGELARQVGCTRGAVHHVLLRERARRLLKLRVQFIDDPLYHGPDAAAALAALDGAGQIAPADPPEQTRTPRGLPGKLSALYRAPLLTPARERALFLQFNYHKYLFVHARRRLDPEWARSRDLARLERHLADARRVKNELVEANLRLVASVARKHLRPGVELAELLSEGHVTLMRAVEAFDVHRGFRFSTYATLALMKAFARGVSVAGRGSQAAAALPEVADPASRRGLETVADRDLLARLLDRLDTRERTVLREHFGLDGRPAGGTYADVARALGLSKERVRQIEQTALAKLRSAGPGCAGRSGA
jgi:RNA polymerase primary sigma factor